MDNKIAILTTVINNELYQKSSKLFPKDIRKYVIDGSNGMHGLEITFFIHRFKIDIQTIKLLMYFHFRIKKCFRIIHIVSFKVL